MAEIPGMRKIIKWVKRERKKRGFTQMMKLALKKVSGMYELQEEIDSLYYLLNHYVDITKIPPASGPLRELQICQAALLNIFDAICKKQNWTYWMGSGTLLGAVRHKGFIPWDDDIDVYMPRKDYNEVIKNISDIFKTYGDDTLNFWFWNDGLGIGYKGDKTAVIMDIFPMDIVNSGSDDPEEGLRLVTERLKKYQKFYYAKKDKLSYEELINALNDTININNAGGGGKIFIIRQIEFFFNRVIDYLPPIVPQEFIFPLSTEQFEGYTFNAPHDKHACLTKIFGDYMLFPRNGYDPHSLGGKNARWQSALKSGIDMNEVLEKLKEIDKFFRSDI